MSRHVDEIIELIDTVIDVGDQQPSGQDFCESVATSDECWRCYQQAGEGPTGLCPLCAQEMQNPERTAADPRVPSFEAHLPSLTPLQRQAFEELNRVRERPHREFGTNAVLHIGDIQIPIEGYEMSFEIDQGVEYYDGPFSHRPPSRVGRAHVRLIGYHPHDLARLLMTLPTREFSSNDF